MRIARCEDLVSEEQINEIFECLFSCTEVNKAEVQEFDLTKINYCTKDPDHLKFIPADKFCIHDILKPYQEKETFDFIKVCSDLTVRVYVPTISPNRPIYQPGTQVKYSACEDRGKNNPYTGTGIITDVFRVESYGKVCHCPNCISSETCKQICAEIWVDTAVHVVFDDFEAKNTSCRLFFENEKSPLHVIQGQNVIDSDVRRDCCTLICSTCDKNLVSDLKDKLVVARKLKRCIYNLVDKPLPGEKMFVIISHPHGTPKHISVGSLVDKYEHENVFTQQFYNTPTCPGTSGAPVLIFGYKGWYSGFNHSGTDMDGKVNYSTIGFDHLSHPGNESLVKQSYGKQKTVFIFEAEPYLKDDWSEKSSQDSQN
uniref:Uncharacterized protein n=1 Tax=Biomphalaria glabrata TaxID=6526 RepID=A0A2C9M4U9_BIOGL